MAIDIPDINDDRGESLDRYDGEECRGVLQKMRRVDEEDLNEYGLIPLVWFFQEEQDATRDALSEEQFAQEVVNNIRQSLWQRLYDQLPFELYLADKSTTSSPRTSSSSRYTATSSVDWTTASMYSRRSNWRSLMPG